MQSASLCAFRRNIRTRARLSHYIQLFLGKIVQIYTRVLIILNTHVLIKYDSLCKVPACVHSDETSGHEPDFPITFSYFQEKQYKYTPCTNNIKYDSLCKGSACLHSDETSGNEPDFPVTFSYFQEKQYKYIHMY